MGDEIHTPESRQVNGFKIYEAPNGNNLQLKMLDF